MVFFIKLGKHQPGFILQIIHPGTISPITRAPSTLSQDLNTPAKAVYPNCSTMSPKPSRPLTLSTSHYVILGLGWVLLVTRKSGLDREWLAPLPLVWGIVPVECILWTTLILHLVFLDIQHSFFRDSDNSEVISDDHEKHE